MARPAAHHPDPLVRDLELIRRLRWSEPNAFRRMDVLFEHELVMELANGSNDPRRRTKALRSALKRVVKQIERLERKHPPPLDRSVAFAATVLLRLDPETEDAEVKDLRDLIARRWKRNETEKITPDGFRQHLETSAVYEPLAAEFRLFAQSEEERRKGFKQKVGNGKRARFAGPPPPDELSKLAQRLWEFEGDTYAQRLNAVRKGVVRVRNEEEMVDLLTMFTDGAQRELQAVDQLAISEWFGNPTLNQYLHLQLKRAERGEVTLERIRLVSEDEMSDARLLRRLQEFVRLHDDASANLLLCPLDVAKRLRTSFNPRMGMLLIDRKTEPLLITGWLGEGLIERALVYPMPTEALRQYETEYDRLRENVIAHNHDKVLRDQVKELLGPVA